MASYALSMTVTYKILSRDSNYILQSFTKYFRLNLVFMQNSALREKFNFCFSGVFASSNKVFILAEDWTLGYYSMDFRDFSDIPIFLRS